jgi:RNA polymerase sigma-70 factor (ECF subfamily)
MPEGDDGELVERCRRGDRDAFAPLVERYQRVLFNVAFRMLGSREEARDATQTAFVRAFEKLHTYDPRHRFFSWIYRIAMNECLNLRSRRRPVQALDPALRSPDDPEAAARAGEVQAAVRRGLLALPEDGREVVVLKHLLGFSYGEIAATLGIPEKTVRSRLYSARLRLAEWMRERRLAP